MKKITVFNKDDVLIQNEQMEPEVLDIKFVDRLYPELLKIKNYSEIN